MSVSNPELCVKKVFFVYPSHQIKTEIIPQLIDKEIEVYTINNHDKLEQVCRKFSSPLLFINIDDAMSEIQWRKKIINLTESESTRHVSIGLLTSNPNEYLYQKFLMDLTIQCGLIKLKNGINKSALQILNTLDSNNVKGKRKYIRATCPLGTASFNTSIFNKFYQGSIIDISSVGMSVVFDICPELVKNSYLDDIQLRLKGSLIAISAVVIGFRKMEGERTIFVLLFDPKTSDQMKFKIRLFIHKTLQCEINEKLKLSNIL